MRVMYPLFGGLLGTGILAGAVGALKDPAFWVPTALLGFAFAACMSWLATTRLRRTSDALHYRSLLTKVDVALEDILIAKYERGFVAFTYQPYYRIVLTVRDKAQSSKKIIINAGLFYPAEVKRWIEEVNSMVKSTRNYGDWEGRP
jgi:hypothetical protein